MDATNAPARYEAPSVLLSGTPDRIMLIGGYDENTGGSPASSAEIIDFSDAAPTWTATTLMAFRRRDHNAAILPDGTVLVVGGRSNSSGTPNPVMIPEIFDPVSETWDQVAPHQIPRRYHSTATLLPDARVLVAGGDFQPSGEIYSPPYLFGGARPVISMSPGVVSYGGTFNIEFSSATITNTIALVRLSSVTHSVNMDQRYVPLAQDIAPGQGITISAPADANLAPPGYYMLFVVSAEGVPSVSAMMQVLPAITGDFNGDRVVDGADLAKWGSDFGAGAGSDADGDGDSDGADFLVWQRSVGATNVASATATVPEPSSQAHFTFVAIIVFHWRRRSFGNFSSRRWLSNFHFSIGHRVQWIASAKYPRDRI